MISCVFFLGRKRPAVPSPTLEPTWTSPPSPPGRCVFSEEWGTLDCPFLNAFHCLGFFSSLAMDIRPYCIYLIASLLL